MCPCSNTLGLPVGVKMMIGASYVHFGETQSGRN